MLYSNTEVDYFYAFFNLYVAQLYSISIVLRWLIRAMDTCILLEARLTTSFWVELGCKWMLYSSLFSMLSIERRHTYCDLAFLLYPRSTRNNSHLNWADAEWLSAYTEPTVDEEGALIETLIIVTRNYIYYIYLVFIGVILYNFLQEAGILILVAAIPVQKITH